MADHSRHGNLERDVEQAIIALKKGAQLLKYGRRGKPKFCPFKLSNDENALIWYSGGEEKKLWLSTVSKILSGQRTVIIATASFFALSKARKGVPVVFTDILERGTVAGFDMQG